ncbi:zinc ribbon domain-containing protein [Halomicroarcula sp. GCM10025324]|uniref:DUF7577 domain-containing protein n=1 Tax=Haloarcula TaxID=2237 RepID=UPI0023E7DBA0|nr:zinc ribbon domain-containing protein [Halomicroarcula sp. ZS-22-S1]
MVSEWLYGAIALLVGVHVLTMLYAYWRNSDVADTAAQAEPRPTTSDDHSTERVTCPHCGVPNQSGYRFCRQCVSNLDSKTAARPQVEQGQPH